MTSASAFVNSTAIFSQIRREGLAVAVGAVLQYGQSRDGARMDLWQLAMEKRTRERPQGNEIVV